MHFSTTPPAALPARSTTSRIAHTSSPADACECADSTPEILAPHDGAAGVPTNTRVLVSALKAGAAKWAASDATAKPPALAVAPMRAAKPGKGVKAAISTMMSENWGTVFVIAPARPLAPGTRYVIIATPPAPGAGAQATHPAPGAGGPAPARWP